jgi:DNA-binding MurR/RpiR family transcriptional regulator
MFAEIIQRNFFSLTQQQRKVADFFLTRGSEAAFLSVAALARGSNTSPATIVRFSRAIGFTGYLDLQKNFQNWVKQKLSPPSEILQNLITKEPKDDIFKNMFQIDFQNLAEAQEANSRELLEKTIKEILRARRVGFTGCRTSSGIASLIYYFMARVRKNCELLDGGNLTHQLMNYGPRDLMLGISFPRYSRHTLEILKYGKKVGCRIVALTDSPISPIGQVADIVLVAGRRSGAYFNSFTSAVALVNCLVAGASLKSKRSLRTLEAFDRIDEEWNPFVA